MKKSITVILIIVAVIAIIFFWYQGIFNGLVQADENVGKAWSNVESTYQYRADLLPNSVEVVKGYAEHEKVTLEAVVNARAKATQVTIDPTHLNEQTMAQFQQAQSELGSAISRLLVSMEAYPDLKAIESFTNLQVNIEGAENRINVARQRYNDAAVEYNTKVRRFPNNLIANLSGFTVKPYFKAEAGTEKAPEIKF